MRKANGAGNESWRGGGPRATATCRWSQHLYAECDELRTHLAEAVITGGWAAEEKERESQADNKNTFE